MSIIIRIGDCRALLAAMPDESVNCVVTSPPYWGLRDYGVAGQIGMEPTLAEHLQVLLEVFREVRRVLRKDGTCWINYGDCYATSPNGRSAADTKAAGTDDRTFRDKPFSTIQGTMKPKDLCMIPNRLAIALQDDGWWVRSEIIWHKPNPMPESITDRPATSHEKVWLLTRSERYFYDAAAVRTEPRGEERKKVQPAKPRALTPRHEGHINHTSLDAAARGEGANLKNVWTIATAAFSEAHFATFPPALVEPCIKAGCPEGGTVLDPFGGAGTVGLVADRLGRDAILLELNPEYASIAERRIKNDAGMFNGVSIDGI